MHNYTVTTPPTGDVVTLAEAKSIMRVTSSAEDALIQSYITVATTHIEQYTRRDLRSRVYHVDVDRFQYSKLERFPFFEIFRSPVTTVSSVEVFNGTEFVEEQYSLKQQDGFPRILFDENPYFQSFYNFYENVPFPIRADFTAGYADGDVPEEIKIAIMMYANYLFSNRGDCLSSCSDGMLPQEVRTLIDMYRLSDGYVI